MSETPNSPSVGAPQSAMAIKAAGRLLMLWAFVLLCLVLVRSAYSPSIRLTAIISLFVLVLGTVTLSATQRAGFWSRASGYFVVLGVFHVGLPPYWIFGGDPEFTRAADYGWFGGPLGLAALWLVIYAMCAYLVGTFLATVRPAGSSAAAAGMSGPAAEPFRNFGVAGVLAIPQPLGALMGAFGRQRTDLGMALFVCVEVPLFNHVRNSFVPVLQAVVAAVIPLGILIVLRNRGRPSRAVAA